MNNSIHVCVLTEHKKENDKKKSREKLGNIWLSFNFEILKDEMSAKYLEEWEELSTLKDREYIHLHRENS